jgi:hypothetical protein
MSKPSLSASYQPPVSNLLTFGEAEPFLKDWSKYVQRLGFTSDHIPELIKLMMDEDLWFSAPDAVVGSATIHAWRSLAQLGALEMIPPVLELSNRYEDDDWLLDELPSIIRVLGRAVIPQVEVELANLAHLEHTRIVLAEGLFKISEDDPTEVDRCIAIARKQLESYRENGDRVNGMLVEILVHYKVMDALPLIEEVYQSGKVDDLFAGTWPSIQVTLGLKQESDFRPDELQHRLFRNFQAMKLLQALPNNSDEEEEEELEDLLPMRNPNQPSLFQRSVSRDDLDLKIPKTVTQLDEKKGFGATKASGNGKKSKKKSKKS